MQIPSNFLCSTLIAGLLSLSAKAQSPPLSMTVDSTQSSAQSGSPLFTAEPDSLNRIQDSLEVALLKTSHTYQQVERLLATLPRDSRYLDKLPSVLPVELPIDSFRVTSPFGLRKHPVLGTARFHAGLDVKAPLGMRVRATALGVVSRVGHSPNLGAFVQIRHAFGFETTFGHLTGYCVQPGQTVRRFDEIGRVGKTGLTTGPHLHYALKKNGSIVDPFFFCFLLRRRLLFYDEKSKASGVLVSGEATNGSLVKGK